MKAKSWLLLIFLLMPLAVPAGATNYYMSPTGSDAAAGTIGAPWATMQYACYHITAGDTLFVRGGTYTGLQAFLSTVAGTASSPIVVMAYPGEYPLFTGLHADHGSPYVDYRFHIRHNNIKVKGIASVGGAELGTWYNNIQTVVQDCDSISFTNCKFSGIPSDNIRNSTYYNRTMKIMNSGYVTVDACTLQYAGNCGNYPTCTACWTRPDSTYAGGYPLNQGDGCVLAIFSGSHHVIVKNSLIRYGHHDIISINQDAGTGPHHIIIENNIIDANGTDDFMTGWGGGYGIGISTVSSLSDTLAKYILIQNNKIRGGSYTYIVKAGIFLASGVGCTIRDNLIWNCGYTGLVIQDAGEALRRTRHNFIYNNSILHSGRKAFALFAYTATGDITHITDNLIANNIIYGSHEHYAYDWWPMDRTVCIWDVDGSTGWDTDSLTTTLGKNYFKNNLIGTVADADTNVSILLRKYNVDGVLLGDSIQEVFPSAFVNNIFDDPDFASESYSGTELTVASPCVNAGIRMTLLDTVVARIMTAWPAAGVDTLIWYGTAPDIGEYETDPDCMPAIKSGIATQAITYITATLHFHTDSLVVSHFRYHPTGNHPWVYRSGGADSVQHTISVTGFTPDSTYVWESNTKQTGCDSTAYGDSTSFTTLCPTVVKSAFASQAIGAATATLHFHTDYVVKATYRYHESPGGAWSEVDDVDADSLQHTKVITALADSTLYTWESKVNYLGCDDTAFADSTSFTTLNAAATGNRRRCCCPCKNR